MNSISVHLCKPFSLPSRATRWLSEWWPLLAILVALGGVFVPIISCLSDGDTLAARNLADSLTRAAYAQALLARQLGQAEPTAAPDSDYEHAVLNISRSVLTDSDVEAALEVNARLLKDNQLYVTCFGTVDHVKYPIFSNREIDRTVGSLRPEAYLSYFGIAD